jgi:hypothetical protein
MEKFYAEATQTTEAHRKILLGNFNFLVENKWGKENNKFSGDLGLSQYLPCMKNEEQLSSPVQEVLITDSRIRI